MLNFLGAKLVLTPKELGMNGAIEEAKKIHKKTKNSLILDQFINKANPDIHFKTTAKRYGMIPKVISIFLLLVLEQEGQLVE